MGEAMREALLGYREKALKCRRFWMPHDFDDVEPEMAEQFKRNFLISRTAAMDLSPFVERFGYELPDEIKEYMSLYLHPHIAGCYDCMQENEKGQYKFDDSLVLFAVMKHKGESDDDILFQKYGIIDMTEEWLGMCREEAENDPALEEYLHEAEDHIPIGWSYYYGFEILFCRSTKEIYLAADRSDRFVCERPIARSLSELINGMYFNL